MTDAANALNAIREEAGAEAAAFVGLGDIGGRLFVSHSLMHAPESWDLSWASLDGWSVRVLFDMPAMWASLVTDQLAPVPLELFRHGAQLLPGRAVEASGWALGRLVQTDHQLAGFVLMWPFPTLDRVELARFRVGESLTELCPLLARRMRMQQVPTRGRTAVLASATGRAVHTDPCPDHPLQTERIASRVAEAVRSMRAIEPMATGSAHGWHLRLHRLDEDHIGLRMTPIRPVPLPITHVLPPQQRRVALLAAAGQSVEDIAERLDVKPQTVRSHLKHVYRRLRASNRVQLANRLQNDPIHKTFIP